MTTALAMEYIPRRMRELGHRDGYLLRFRHLVLEPEQILTIEADNHIYLLVEQISDASISSEMGVYDLTDPALNELCYEHQGRITIQNYSPQRLHLRMIQIIPSNSKQLMQNNEQQTR